MNNLIEMKLIELNFQNWIQRERIIITDKLIQNRNWIDEWKISNKLEIKWLNWWKLNEWNKKFESYLK